LSLKNLCQRYNNKTLWNENSSIIVENIGLKDIPAYLSGFGFTDGLI